MGDNYELIPFDYENGGNQQSIFCHTWREALKKLKELSKQYYCVTLVVRTEKQGLK